jgi:hypothetical protein
MSARMPSKDPDIIASFAALKRSARRAFKLAKETGTPFYVMKKGKIVDLNASARKQKKR